MIKMNLDNHIRSIENLIQLKETTLHRLDEMREANRENAKIVNEMIRLNNEIKIKIEKDQQKLTTLIDDIHKFQADSDNIDSENEF